MKKGDKVRFLNEKGGGVVTGFQGRDIVLVEDADGFEIPFRVNEVVVVEGNDYSTAKLSNTRMADAEAQKVGTPLASDNRSIKSLMREGQDAEAEEFLADADRFDVVDDEKEITYQAPVEERRGGNSLTAYMAFVPTQVQALSNSSFDLYLVNDCNYYLQVQLMADEGNSWVLRAQHEVAPNTKLFLETLTTDDLNELHQLSFQALAYKKEKRFLLKPAVSAQFKVEPLKFLKRHTFVDNAFFDEPAYLLAVVEDDVAAKPLAVDAVALEQALIAKKHADEAPHPAKTPSHTRKQEDVVVVDLHINALLDTTQGMTSKDILDYQLKVFNDTLAAYSKQRGQKIIFIHGKGEGVLRSALLNALNYRYKKYTYQDASFQEYGYGATQITIR